MQRRGYQQLEDLNDESPVAEERCGGARRLFYADKGGKFRVVDAKQHQTWRKVFYELFLPEGYPDSVSPDYLAFQFWDTVQGLCSYVSGVLASQAVLRGVGVGSDKATPLAAATTWVIRDGTGMLGGLSFAWLQGSNLDANAKSWRLVADVFNDLALVIDLLSPTVPSLFMPLVCISSLCRSVTGVAGGATRAACVRHFALRDNLADVAAKDGSQETATTLLGMLLGMVVARVLDQAATMTWLCFLSLTALHIFANYRAISAIAFRSVNRQRGEILVRRYLDAAQGGSRALVVPGPAEVALEERFLVAALPWQPVNRLLRLGAPLGTVAAGEADLRGLAKAFASERYLAASLGGECRVVLHLEATPRDQCRAFFHAVVAALQGSPGDAGAVTKRHFDGFYDALREAGWNTANFLLGFQEYRSSWRVGNEAGC